ncbi:hypothetical protein [Endozoicomonas sp. 8E]|uniref:hypothetical protein n=1 Tax=Endozoicomonas sp. 8E TaxID=3035692 RepID=UPI002938EC58|nr:hypothetical protein [Endozoicomonas sp. 8E]WOG27725.1 hypothetical protein P6910_24780 [Endozoicomonas sp. 8E]
MSDINTVIRKIVRHWLPAATLLFIPHSLAFTPQEITSVPGAAFDVTDSEFCQKARFEREKAVGREPDLSKIEVVTAQDAALCFTPDENLFFVANQEAQNILGPHAPWYLQISREFRERVKEACKIMGYQNDDVSRAYDHCLEDRYEELMGPYEDKYRREAGNYLSKRRQVAESLVVRCDAALSIKRSRLPRDLKFPLAYYDKHINALPSWFLEEKLDDTDWIRKMADLKANELMSEVLGDDCPGNMVYWVTYDPPGV